MSSRQSNALILGLNSPEATRDLVGGKGSSLTRLMKAGLPVPRGFQVTTTAYRRFVDENSLLDEILALAAQAAPDNVPALDRASHQIQSLIEHAAVPSDIAAAIGQAYSEFGCEDLPVAVRSSGVAEDSPEMSFAGQHESFLNVRGSSNVVAAVKQCWASLWTPRALGYRARQNMSPSEISLAVVVQELVPADVAGILFTADPLTGNRDLIMINAAWGLGEAIVSGQVTPDSIVINKRSGAIESQQIASKEVMTVRLPEGTGEEPVPIERRNQPALEAPNIGELMRLGLQVEDLYAQPMDIEWAMRDGQISIVQARPITTLPTPEVKLDWKLPRPHGSYWRSSVIELLPDPLSPLFATIGLPVWNAAMRRLAQAIGLGWMMSGDPLTTINDYAYYDFNVKFKPRILLDVFLLIPRGIRLMRRARTRWADVARPAYAAVVTEWGALQLQSVAAVKLLAGVQAIIEGASDHYLAIQSGILPVAYMSETLFTGFYDVVIRRPGDPPALTFLLGFDSMPIRAERSLYHLAMWARVAPELAAYLMHAATVEIVAAAIGSLVPISDAETWAEFDRRLAEHLQRFGHAVYDLDFAKSVPADDPAPLLETIKYFLSGQARDPHERQAASIAAREQATQQILARLGPLRSRLFGIFLRTAQRYAPLREDALADVGLGWPLVRRLLRELGRRLVSGGAIREPDDVFWLKWDELQAAARALDHQVPAGDYGSVAVSRQAIWERERRATPPVVLPVNGGGRFLGIDFRRWMPARTDQKAGATIQGVGASPGRVSGVADVIHGPGEFNQMRPGDVLVAKITTPAWTPLFALASAVVTDIGGPLSHGSIVAREYHIPAVLGTGIATERIHSGQQITVDGDVGSVTVGGPSHPL